MLYFIFWWLVLGGSEIRLSKKTDLLPVFEKNGIFQISAIVSDNNNLYLFSSDNYELVHFSRNKKNVLWKVGGQGNGPGEFLRAVSQILVTPDEKIVAVEKGYNRIHFFDPTGKFLYRFDLNKTTGMPQSVALGQQNELWVTDLGNYIHKEFIQVFDFQGTLLKSGIDDPYYRPWIYDKSIANQKERITNTATLMAKHFRQIALDKENNIYLGGYYNYSLEKYTSEFKLLWKKELSFNRKTEPSADYNLKGTMPELLGPSYGSGAVCDMTFDSKGYLWVSLGQEHSYTDSEKEYLEHWIDVFDKDGTKVATLLKGELPHFKAGYKLDIWENRLIVQGEQSLNVYEISYNNGFAIKN